MRNGTSAGVVICAPCVAGAGARAMLASDANERTLAATTTGARRSVASVDKGLSTPDVGISQVVPRLIRQTTR